MLTEYDAAELLLAINAVTFRPTNPFRYESGLLSPIYVDCRLLSSHPRERALFADSLTEAFRQSGATAETVVGTGASAIPLAEGVSRRLQLPMAYVRREAKIHGMRKQIEGASVDKRQVLLISDIVSTGADIPTSVEAIRMAGGTISRCQAVFDMELEDNDRFLAGNMIPYGSLTKLSDLLVVAEIKKHLSKTERTLVEEWHHSPTAWDTLRRQKLEDALRRNKRAVAETLLRTKAVQLRTDPPFDYSGGGKGPIYTDTRILLAQPQEREVILNTMTDAVVQEVGIQNIDCIGAVATAGIPYASGLSDRLNLPMVIVKSIAEEHGFGRRIEGALERGLRVLLLEDLVNKGTSIFSAVDCLRDAGAIVIACMAVFTYGLKATREKITANNLTLLSLSDLDSLLMIGVENGVITHEQQKLVQSWAVNPNGWMTVR
jgi:orotate phosphoribosyltransferase